MLWLIKKLSEPIFPLLWCSDSYTLVEMSGLEPPTPTLSGWCSNQLSYISLYLIVLPPYIASGDGIAVALRS